MLQRLDFKRAFELSQKTDLYERLGVERDAAPDTIYAASCKLLALVHPRRNQEREEQATLATTRITEASTTLLDTERRLAYDREHTPTAADSIDWSKDIRLGQTVTREPIPLDTSEEPGVTVIKSTTNEAFFKDFLSKRGVPATKEGIVAWLENPPRRLNGVEILTVWIVSKALGLVTPEDIRNDTGIAGAMWKILLHGGSRPASPQPGPTRPTDRDSALAALTGLLDHGSHIPYSFGVREAWTETFRSIKDESIASRFLAASEIADSPEIQNATQRMSSRFEERLKDIVDGHLLHDATKNFVAFIEEHSLFIPDDVRQSLLTTYTTHLNDRMSAERVSYADGVGVDRDGAEAIVDLKRRLGPQMG
jgi:hypothetical protein